MISREEVERLAELARLRVSDSEVPQLQKDISGILEYVGQIAQYEAAAPSGEAKPLVRNVLRADTLRAEGDPLGSTAEALRAAFPKREQDFNVVRKIIQKDE